VDEAGHEPLKQLLLPEHDHGLVLDPLRHVAEAIDGLAELDEIDEQLCPSREQRAGDGEERRQRERSERDVYGSALPLTTAPSSALR
jgi:hypothetical protein